MHKTAVWYGIGKLLQVLGLILLAPLGLAVWDYRSLAAMDILRAPEVIGFIAAVFICLALGSLLSRWFRGGRELQGVREGFAIVAIGWMTIALISCVPLFLYFQAERSGAAAMFASFTDAFFELMSGLTTTGATILEDIEDIPRSLLLLRALAHWLGGMGIITLAIAIFPSLGVSAYQMFRGEVPGPSADKLQPRLAQTGAVLWGVYVLLTAAETLLLWIGGMDVFEAICHAFATMATGGFSTRNASIGAFESDFIRWVITVFMFLAGVNFLLHFQALRGRPRLMLDNREFRFYAGIVGAAILIATIVLYLDGPAPMEIAADHYRYSPMPPLEFADHYARQVQEVSGLYASFRTAAFNVMSIVTTTGFATADFDTWPNLLRAMLVLLMFFGGCAGSTGGGMKMVRVMVVIKVAWNVLRKMTQPRLVAPVKVGDRAVDERTLLNIVAFFILFSGMFVVVGLLMTLFVPDLTTALTASIATLGNIGPGLAGVGAAENYAWIPLPAKWLLVFAMLLGRLEIFTVLIVLRPSVWRK